MDPNPLGTLASWSTDAIFYFSHNTWSLPFPRPYSHSLLKSGCAWTPREAPQPGPFAHPEDQYFCSFPFPIMATMRPKPLRFLSVHGAESRATGLLAFEGCSQPLSEFEKGTSLGHSWARRLCMKKVALSSDGLGLQLILICLASIHSTWGPCGFYLIPSIFSSASLPSSPAKLAYFLNTAGMFSPCPFLVPLCSHHPHFYQGFCQVSPPSTETL